MAMHFLVLLSFMIIGTITGATVVMRLVLQLQQFMSERYENERIKGAAGLHITQGKLEKAFTEADRRIRGSSSGAPDTPRSGRSTRSDCGLPSPSPSPPSVHAQKLDLQAPSASSGQPSAEAAGRIQDA